MTPTRQWLLNDHPRGRPIADGDLKLVTVNTPAPGPGEMLLKTLYLSFDPAQKGWMENVADYVAPMNIGDVAAILRAGGVSYALIGAHAMAARGYARSTAPGQIRACCRRGFQSGRRTGAPGRREWRR